MQHQMTRFALALLLMGIAQAHADSPSNKTVPVTVDTYTRAQSDIYMGAQAKRTGTGVYVHTREPYPIDKQDVVRPNRDTLYSMSVFDLDAGPVTITLPDAGKRYMALQVINEDQYVPAVVYGGGTYTFDKEKVGTRYAGIPVRILVDPNDPKDVQAVHALQDAIQVKQAGRGSFEAPNWDPESTKKVRDALLVLASTLPDLRGDFGTKQEVDPVHHLIGTAAGWGGNPDKDAIYLNVTPPKNDGKTVYHLNVNDVPVDGFWSISVYDAKGYFKKNALNAYALNNLTAKKNADGSIAIQFGGCDGKVPNCLPITPGWNYMVRLYRPRAAILDGSWKFPAAHE